MSYSTIFAQLTSSRENQSNERRISFQLVSFSIWMMEKPEENLISNKVIQFEKFLKSHKALFYSRFPFKQVNQIITSLKEIRHVIKNKFANYSKNEKNVYPFLLFSNVEWNKKYIFWAGLKKVSTCHTKYVGSPSSVAVSSSKLIPGICSSCSID